MPQPRRCSGTGPEATYLVGGIPSHGRDVGTVWSLGSLATKDFHDSMINVHLILQVFPLFKVLLVILANFFLFLVLYKYVNIYISKLLQIVNGCSVHMCILKYLSTLIFKMLVYEMDWLHGRM